MYRRSFPPPMMPWQDICGISTGFPVLSPCTRLVVHALLARSPLPVPLISPKKSERNFSFDLHVLSTPPAFVLSQDQTLEKIFFKPDGLKFLVPNLLLGLPPPGGCEITDGYRFNHLLILVETSWTSSPIGFGRLSERTVSIYESTGSSLI